MAISDYSTTRDSNASIAPGDLRSNDYRRDQQIINAIRQLMADLAAMAAGGVGGIEKITIVRNGAETFQYFELGLSDATGHLITGFSAANNAKGFVFDATTDTSDTAPSAGENSFSFQIRGVEKFRIDDSSNVSHFRHKVDIQDASGNILTRISDDANGAIEIGKVNGSTSTPYIDFHSSATVADYNARIKCSGGSGTSGSGTLEFDADIVDLIQGQLKFPATQQASSDANTLDDYEEGTWTPTITFSTPGDLSVAYSTQAGTYLKVGQLVWAKCILVTSTFTHTTASGEFRVDGLPFTSQSTHGENTGSVEMSNVTHAAGRTYMTCNNPANTVYLRFIDSGSAVTRDAIDSSEALSGTSKTIIASVVYRASN